MPRPKKFTRVCVDNVDKNLLEMAEEVAAKNGTPLAPFLQNAVVRSLNSFLGRRNPRSKSSAAVEVVQTEKRYMAAGAALKFVREHGFWPPGYRSGPPRAHTR